MRKPATLDHIRVHCDAASDEDLGRIIGVLIRSGHPISGLEHVTDVLSYKQGRPDSTLLTDKFLTEHPTFARHELVALLEPEGFSKSTSDSTIRRWLEAKAVKKIGPAHYQRADVKTLEAPKKKVKVKAKPKKKALKRRRRYAFGNAELILDAIEGKDRFFSADLEKVLEKNKRNPKSVGPILSKMVKERQVKRLERGLYEVVIDKPPAASTNGSTGAEQHG